MKPRPNRFFFISAAAATALIGRVDALDFVKANNVTALNATGSYTTAGVPGGSDTIVVDSTVTALQNTPLGGNLGILGIRYASNAQTTDRLRINSTGSYTLSLGSGGIDMSGTSGDVRLRIDSKIDFTANQNWTIANGARVNMNPASVTGSGGNAIVSGAGSVTFDVGGSGTLGSVITFTNSVVQINSSTTTAAFNNANNSYGRLNVYNGRGVFADIANKNSNSSAGTGATDTILGGNSTNGIFEFSGSSMSTNRGFQVDNRSSASGIDVTTSGVTLVVGGNISSTFGTSTSANSGLVFGGAGNLTIGGVVNDKADATGKTSVTKNGGGALNLTNANTYEGGTTVTAGSLLVNNTTGSATGNGNVQINSGATLGGSGIIAGATTTIAGTLAPGNSPGALTINGGTLALAVGADYDFQVFNAIGAAGTGYDTVALINGGTLDLSVLTANSFAINLLGLSAIGPDASGPATNFNNALSHSWTLFSTGSDLSSSFDAGDFTINTAGFSNALGGGSFSMGLADGNTDIVLNFTPVPEPRAALLGGLGLLALLRRRRD